MSGRCDDCDRRTASPRYVGGERLCPRCEEIAASARRAGR